MILLWIILLLVALALVALVWLDSTRGLHFDVLAHAESGGVSVSVRQLPSLQINVDLVDAVPMLVVKLFHRQFIKRRLLHTGKAHGSINIRRLLRALVLLHMRVSAAYGLRDPFETGLACAAIGAVLRLFDVTAVSYQPDFLPEEPFVDIQTDFRLKLGKTMLNYIRNKA